MARNDHFDTVADWTQAAGLVDFEPRRPALSTPYGLAPVTVRVAGQEARSYALGPVPDPDDIDGRSPAVVVWHESDRVYLVASGQLEAETLLRIAASLYD
ncbi:hypothetical protein A8C75_12560 [Marinobacterium aestuarii]|uniref:DUF4367 domain-containing protein n=2 Tax=Marinobacterium aestuarii TaxID=1821621 RepID=A0A1A9F0E7_9GAMM|nr:hypothetical protein A8C75_12560 [Marinobacterium aestuarii]